MRQRAGDNGGLSPGQRLLVRINSIANGGDGVSRDTDLPLFVARTAPGDLALVEVFDVRKDFARARLVEVVEAGSGRCEPPCKLFKVCGGCQWQHMTYESQAEAKADLVRQAVKHIGGLDPAVVLPARAAARPLAYRNKVQFPVANPRGSPRLLAGYFREGSHDLVNIKHCPVQPQALDRMLAAVKEACERQALPAYDEGRRQGFLRHICARMSHAEGAILLTFVVNAGGPDDARAQCQGQLARLSSVAGEVMAAVPEVAGVCVNFNNRPGNRIMGEVTVNIAGASHIVETIATASRDLPDRLRQGIKFRLSPTSFFQVNPDQAVCLFEEVYAGLPETRRLVVDAFAGVGAMSLWLAPAVGRVIAVEEHRAAVEDAKANLSLNAIANVDFRLGRVEDVLPEVGRPVDAIVLDPPRKGVSPQALQAVVSLSAPRLIYVSCNPSTLARDLKILSGNGYKTKRITPVDMFPQTYHVESVAILDRQD